MIRLTKIPTIIFLSLGIAFAQFQPETKEELQTAVDLWVSDNTSALSSYGEINTWDVSLITDMSNLFENKTTFTSNISSWNTSNVTDMRFMFHRASTYDKNMDSWDLSSVTSMAGMFREASSFNQNISNWDVSNVTDMSYVFSGRVPLMLIFRIGIRRG